MTTNQRKTFSITADLLKTLSAMAILGRLPANLDEAEIGRLDWHIRNASLAVSGTAQHASYNGLVGFVATHYAALRNEPASDELYERAITTGLKGGVKLVRKADSLDAMHAAYKTLVSNIAAFLESANDPMHKGPTAEQLARRRAVAEAIWNRRRVDEDREDQDLDDLPTSHSVWEEADAVLAVLALEPAPAA